MRIRTKGRPIEYKTVNSYEEAEEFELLTGADRLRGVETVSPASQITFAQLVQRFIKEECVEHKGEDIEVGTLEGMLADSRGDLTRARRAFEEAGPKAKIRSP